MYLKIEKGDWTQQLIVFVIVNGVLWVKLLIIQNVFKRLYVFHTVEYVSVSCFRQHTLLQDVLSVKWYPSDQNLQSLYLNDFLKEYWIKEQHSSSSCHQEIKISKRSIAIHFTGKIDTKSMFHCLPLLKNHFLGTVTQT